MSDDKREAELEAASKDYGEAAVFARIARLEAVLEAAKKVDDLLHPGQLDPPLRHAAMELSHRISDHDAAQRAEETTDDE